MAQRLFFYSALLMLGQSDCLKKTSNITPVASYEFTIETLASEDSGNLIPSSTLAMELSDETITRPTSRTSNISTSIDGIPYGGWLRSGSFRTHAGVTHYEIRAVARRVSKKEIDVQISSTLPGELHLQHAPAGTIVAESAELLSGPPYKLACGEHHLRIVLRDRVTATRKGTTVDSQPATRSAAITSIQNESK